MKAATHNGRAGKARKLPSRAMSERPETRTVGRAVKRVMLPEVEAFADSAESVEVQALTRDLREVHDAQVADDDFQ